MTTTVVHVRKSRFDVYIGRANLEFPSSPFGNPFLIGPYGPRNEVIARYEIYITERLAAEPELRAQLEALRGRRLGCWCKPRACHGDVLVKLLEGDAPEQAGLF